MQIGVQNIYNFFVCKFPWLERFVKFGLVGLSNTAIAWIVFYCLIYFTNIHYQAANVASFIVSVINAYLWNRFWVFKDAKTSRSTPIKFGVVYVGNLFLGIALAFLLVEVMQMSEFWFPPLLLCITVPTNFLLNKYWTFGK